MKERREVFLYQFLIRTERKKKQDAVLWHDISMRDAEGRLVYNKK